MKLNRKFALILAFLTAGSVLLTGCVGEDELDLDNGTGIIEPSGAADEEGDNQESVTDENDMDQNSENEESSSMNDESEKFNLFNGILKAINMDEGTITVENETDGQMVLTLNENSQIIEGDSPISFDDLEKNVGTNIIAEYDDSKNVITIICSKG